MTGRPFDRLLALAAASVIVMDVSAIATLQARPPVAEPPARRCTRPVAEDGDTIRCANQRAAIRMIGIDAPELPGHCRKGRVCVPGDPVASTDALKARLARGRVTVQSFGTDLYGRTLGIVRARGVNLSCTQMAEGGAIFKPGWDHQHRIDRECFGEGGQ